MSTVAVLGWVTAPAPRHHVRVGHTEFVAQPVEVTRAWCWEHGATCLWSEDAAHVRAVGVHHAEETGHRVQVAEGCALTFVEVTS